MKRLILSVIVALAFGTPYAVAQSKTSKQEPLTTKASKFWKKTKRNLKNAGQEVKDAIGINSGSKNPLDDGENVSIDGVYYMPLYSVNLYAGQDAAVYCDTCRSLFKKKFPHADIMSIALPQKQWLSTAVKKKDEVEGYLQTMYCYVIARDGSDGYINSKFMFQRYRDVGGNYNHVLDTWPKWVKTEALPNDIYEKLKNK